MKFLNYILEARGGGTPKVSAIEVLSKYKDDPDVYISYTSLEKLGINPQYDYGTPLAIYFYPLKGIWRYVINDTVPFAGERAWIWVVRTKSLLDLDTYTQAKLWQDIQKLLDKEVYEKVSRETFNKFKDIIREILSGRRAISDGIPQLGPAAELFMNDLKIALNDGGLSNPGKLIWYFTHNLAKTQERNRAPFRWTEILRKVLGYKGVRDTKGIIHRNEPQQAIVFSLRDLQIVEKIKNVEPDRTERIVAKTLIEYLELVKDQSNIGLDSVIQNRITKARANEKMIIIKDNAFKKMRLEDFKYILNLDVGLEGITIIKLIAAKNWDPVFIKAAVDSKSIVLIEDIDSAVFYIKEFHIFNRIQQYFEYDKKANKPWSSWTRALINLPKVIESFTVKKYIKFMRGLTKDRILNVYEIFTAAALMLDLKGNKKDAVGYFIGDIYPRYIQVEAAKDHPETVDKVIDLFKRDVLNRAPLRGLPSLSSLEKFIDKKYIEKYW